MKPPRYKIVKLNSGEYTFMERGCFGWSIVTFPDFDSINTELFFKPFYTTDPDKARIKFKEHIEQKRRSRDEKRRMREKEKERKRIRTTVHFGEKYRE